jgi:Tfp pilus assembly protein PilN
MIRTNLSTRPFYNVRAVHMALGACAVVVLAVMLFDAVQIWRLSASQQILGAQADAAEREATRLRSEASRIRGQINPRELETVANAAREANGIIDRRTFSWTVLLAQFESTLPDDVRITAVSPRLERDVFIVGVSLEARRPEDLDDFIVALESTGTFRNVLATTTQMNGDGLLEAIVEGEYRAPTPSATGAEARP